MAGLLADALTEAGFKTKTAADSKSARKMIDSFDPDILLLDISLGDGPTGIQIAHAVSRTRPDIAILILTKHPDPKAGGDLSLDLPDKVGFLRKHLVRDTDYLLNAIEEVLADRPEQVTTQVEAITRPFPQLNDKAFQVLRLLAEGYNNNEIAKQMALSLKAIERWIEIIYAELDIKLKADLNPRVEAARRFYMVAGLSERDS